MKTFSMTDVGRIRQINQDFIFTSENQVGKLPNLFIVADGMGGHNAGDFASRYTVETVVDLIRQSEEKEVVTIIKKAVEQANSMLIEKASADEQLAGMGTTLVLCTIEGNEACVANVGDSRLYLLNDEIRQITKDHSLVEEMVRMGELEPENAKMHPNKNIITRAIGAVEEVTVDFFTVPLQSGDKILMCSDGLSNMLEDDEIRMIVDRQQDLVDGVQTLISRANQNGGKDNIAVILIEPFLDEVKEC